MSDLNENKIGNFDPFILEKPSEQKIKVFLGFHLRSKKWLRVLIGPSPQIANHSGLRGIPKIIQIIQEKPLIVFIEDQVRLDKILFSENKKGRTVPAKIIVNFINSIESVMDLTSDVLLSPSLIYFNKEFFEFGGVGLDYSNKYSLLSWISALITGDAEFLTEKNPWELFTKWEGRLPSDWNNQDLWLSSLTNQMNTVKKWLRFFEEGSFQSLFSSQKENSQFSSNFINPSGEWGFRAGLSFTTLDPSKFSFDLCQSLIFTITQWTPDLLEWAWKSQLFPWLGVKWFLGVLIKDSQIEFKPELIIKALPSMVLGEIKKIKTTHPSYVTKQDLESLFHKLSLYEFKSPIINWLKNPEFNKLNMLDPIERLNMLPLTILKNEINPNQNNLNLALGLTCIIEANQYLTNDSSSKCDWVIIKNLIEMIESPKTRNSPPTSIIKLIEDLHSVLKQHPVGNNYERSEAIAYLIAHHHWLLSSSVIYATGGIFDVLIKNKKEKFLHKDRNPILEFVEILVTKETSTTDLGWQNLIRKWKIKYPKHQFIPLIQGILGK